MALDPEAKVFLEARAKVLPLTGTVSAKEMREIHRKLQAQISKGPDLCGIEDLHCPTPEGGIAARLYRPRTAGKRLIVYFHGGGYAVGSLDAWDAVLSRLVAASGDFVVSIDHRLAPEHPFPAAVYDAFAAVRWADTLRGNLSRDKLSLVVAGDSAGATLATVAAMQMRDDGGPDLAAQILLYPGVDGDIDAPSMTRFIPPSLRRGEIAWYYDQHIPDKTQRRDPRFSPLNADDLRSLPPAFIGTVADDLFREGADRYAERLRASEVRVAAECYEGTFHGFFSADRGVLPHSGMAIADVTAFLATTDERG